MLVSPSLTTGSLFDFSRAFIGSIRAIYRTPRISLSANEILTELDGKVMLLPEFYMFRSSDERECILYKNFVQMVDKYKIITGQLLKNRLHLHELYDFTSKFYTFQVLFLLFGKLKYNILYLYEF